MPRRVLLDEHIEFIRSIKRKKPDATYPRIAKEIQIKFGVEIKDATIGNYWRGYQKKRDSKKKKKQIYEFESICSHRFRKGKRGIIRNNPYFEIKWKGSERTTEIRENEFVESQNLLNYVIDMLYIYEKRNNILLSPK